MKTAARHAITEAVNAAVTARDNRQYVEAQDAASSYDRWHGNESAQDAYVAMIGRCTIVATRADVGRCVIASAPNTRAGRIHGGGILTVMLEAFSQAYPDSEDGVITTLSPTVQSLTW